MKMQLKLLTTLLFFTLSAKAQITAEVALMSDYIARGVSQTDSKPSGYVEIDWNNAQGLFLGSKATGVYLLGDDVGYGAQVDFYGGYTITHEDFTYTLSASYTHYIPNDYTNLTISLPNARLNTQNLTTIEIEGFDFGEIALNVNWQFLEAGVAYTYYGMLPDDMTYSLGDFYYHVAAAHTFENEISASLTLGYYDFDIPDAKEQNYMHLEAKIYKSFQSWGSIGASINIVEGRNRDSSPIFVLLYKKSFQL